MDTAWVHNLSPFLVEFGGGIGIRWYGLAYLSGFALTYLLADFLARRGRTPLTRDQIPDLITYIAIGTMAGGRLGYCLFYSPELFLTFHNSFPFWGVLEVHKGGMASHGGIIGIIVGCYLFARKQGLLTTHLLDLCILGGTTGVFFGRIANFINGELYGRECSPSLWMAVKFPSEIYHWGLREADKLRSLGPAAEALGPWGEFSDGNLMTASRWTSLVDGFSMQAQSTIGQFKEALVLATQEHNQGVIQALAPILTPRYPSQLIQAFLEGFLVVVILLWVWRKPQKPGLISALFGVLYSVARYLGEEYRLPDYHIGFQALGLTRGQWLTLGMFVLTASYLIYIIKRPGKKMGGWS